MKTATLDEIVEELKRLRDQLSDLGFYNLDRIRQQIKQAEHLAQALRDRESGKVVADLTREERRSIEWGLLESLEFAAALRTLEEKGCVPPKEVLKHALHGPVEPILETQKNSRGRNTMFEITIAGDLAAAGLQPRFDLGPDVAFELGAKTILVECKRVSSEKKFPRLIAEAARQLSGHLKHSSLQHRGIMAFCVTPLFTKGDHTLHTDDDRKAIDAMTEATDNLFAEQRESWNKIKDIGIAGAMLHLALPGLLGGKGFATCAHTKIEYSRNTGDRDILNELTSQMQADKG